LRLIWGPWSKWRYLHRGIPIPRKAGRLLSQPRLLASPQAGARAAAERVALDIELRGG